MGKNSSIEWTNHTFNPWWGCTKVSEACDNCYAERWSKRTGNNLWGVTGKRRFFNEKHWQEPLKWNKAAQRKNIRYRVFCASMGDVFENRESLNEWRLKLWNLIGKTTFLDWLILTKRPENIESMVPWEKEWPSNIWLGATVENQELANIRIPILLKSPALIKFISCEPLLGEINVQKWLQGNNPNKKVIDWVIVGGESGPKARPSNPYWVSGLRDQCIETDTLFHFKQWGCWRPIKKTDNKDSHIISISGKNSPLVKMFKDTKKNAGRLLDGRTWNGMPNLKN